MQSLHRGDDASSASRAAASEEGGITSWAPRREELSRPHYLAIAEAIAADIRDGRLAADDRLPPQRALAKALGLNFTTVARGYVEAQRRGLIESRVGAGSFVRGRIAEAPVTRSARRTDVVDLTMNLPPEPSDPRLLERMRVSFAGVAADLTTLLRYQGIGGTPEDKDAGLAWLARRGVGASRERLLICPGAHSALLAVIGGLAGRGDVILCERLTYPGVRAIAAQLGVELHGLAMDAEGIEPAAFEAACATRAPRALYCNPMLLNPTTVTIGAARRQELVRIARRHDVKIIEDDAYAFIPRRPPPAFAVLAPELTYYVAGLAKCLGAGLRLAYLIVPEARRAWPVAAALRTATVMASPVTTAIATRWIAEGVADAVLEAIRHESCARQDLAREILAPHRFEADPEGFHLWLPLPRPWSRASFTGYMRASRLGLVASDAFVVDGPAPEAVRVCLGGFTTRAETRHALEFLADALAQSSSVANGVI